AVQDAAKNNRVVGRIIVTKRRSGRTAAPPELGPRHEAVKVPHVQLLEKIGKVITLALCPGDELAAPRLPQLVQAAANILPVQVEPVTLRIQTRYRLPVKLRQ